MDRKCTNESTVNRNAAIDLLRIIACFLVIVNHTNSNIFMNTEPSLEWFVSLIYHYICKSAVPIFLMISGYTMLLKNDSYQKILKKFVRILLIIVIFSFPYYIQNTLFGSVANFKPVNFLLEIWDSPATMSYWYLYLYAGILLMLPFLQKFANALEKKDFYIFLLIGLAVSSLWPVLVHHKPLLEYSNCVELPLFSATICMLMFGAFMKKWGQECRISKPLCIVVLCLACAYNVFMTYKEYVQTAESNYLFYDEMSYLPILLEAMCLFLLIKDIHVSEKTGKIISTIGSCTFGIYLLSDGLVDCFRGMHVALCDMGTTMIVAAVAWEVVVFIVGLGIVGTFCTAAGKIINVLQATLLQRRRK